MSFNWRGFITLGELLLSPKEEELQEAYWRTSISRLYYGVFGLINKNLKLKGHKTPRDKSVHLYTIETLRKSDSEKERETGLHLDRLRRKRNIADYDGELYVDQTRVRNSHRYAQLILKRL